MARATSKGAGHHEMAALGAGASAVESLDLADVAKEAALELVRLQPKVIFTSGRRTVPKQAHAMAGNVVRNRHWIEQTYTSTAESKSLQRWVNDHPAAKTQQAIAAGLEGIMQGWTDEQKRRVSRHFSGQAFDIQPVAGATGTALKKSIKGLPNLRKFLEREGGLIIWHADFEER